MERTTHYYLKRLVLWDKHCSPFVNVKVAFSKERFLAHTWCRHHSVFSCSNQEVVHTGIGHLSAPTDSGHTGFRTPFVDWNKLTQMLGIKYICSHPMLPLEWHSTAILPHFAYVFIENSLHLRFWVETDSNSWPNRIVAAPLMHPLASALLLSLFFLG